MADFYCDHGIYSSPIAAGTVPTAAEEGNGKSKNAALMATLVIAFSGQPTSGQSMTVGGVAFTAGTTFAIGANATATATNLKNAINASTATVVNPVMISCQVRAAVNATSSGSVVTVYTRVSGGEWNAVSEASTLSNVALTQWRGGADGAWGYFTNPTTLWPSAVAVHNYGVFHKQPFLGDWLPVDRIICRSNKNIVGGSTTFSPFAWAGSSATVMRTLVIDDGTEWPADGTSPVLKVTLPLSGYNGLFGAALPFVRVLAKKYNEVDYGLWLHCINTSYTWSIGFAGGEEYVGLKITNYGSKEFSLISTGQLASYGWQTIFKDCFFQQSGSNYVNFTAGVGYRNAYINFVNCVFDNSGSSVASSGVLLPGTSAAVTSAFGWFDSCKFTNFVSGSKLFNPNWLAVGSRSFWFRNCDFGNVSNLGPNEAVNSGAGFDKTIASSSQYGYRNFFIDNAFGFVEWRQELSMPTCNAKLLDGVTPWSMHITPTIFEARMSRTGFVETPRIGKFNSLASGIRTLSIELAIHDTLALDGSTLSAVIDYQDISGAFMVVDTYDIPGTPLQTSSAIWSQESGGKVTFSDGVVQSHNKFKLTVTTPTAIMAGTEIGIVVRCHKHVPNTTVGIFVDPEVQVV